MEISSVQQIEELVGWEPFHYPTVDVTMVKRGDRTKPMCDNIRWMLADVPISSAVTDRVTCKACLKILRREGHLTASEYLAKLRKIH